MSGKNQPSTHPTSGPKLIPWPHPACLDDDALYLQCEMSKTRSSGPGGQHRNKVETQVNLRHKTTGVFAQAGERRSVEDNKRVALRRMRLQLALEFRYPVPAGPIGSDLWKSRVKSPRKQAPARSQDPVLDELGVKLAPAEGAPGAASGRIACNPDHHDYPALLAEALDVIADSGWDTKSAATRLDVSPSQLVKFIKDFPPAFLLLNRERTKRGDHPLR